VIKKILIRVLGVVLIGALGWGAYRFFKGLNLRQTQTPVTRVRQGDVVVRTFTRGELKAVRTVTIYAPNLFGTIQVTRLAPLGGFAHEKDLVVEFDDSEVQARLDQKQLETEQLGEQIKKAQADLAIRNSQDEVDLLRARYAVRRAELEVQRNPLLSTIDQKKNDLNLTEAKQRLKELESDIKSKQEQSEAELAVLREKWNRAMLDITRERWRLGQVKQLSPMSGLVAVRQNRSGFMGVFGSSVPDIREGDQLQPNVPVADVLDLSELEVLARVGELDRANLREGQDVAIRLDAIPDREFRGKIKSMSGTASANIFSSDPGKKFDVTFSIDMRQLLAALDAKPDQIARVMQTAEENRKHPIATAPSMASVLTGMTAMQGGMPQVAMPPNTVMMAPGGQPAQGAGVRMAAPAGGKAESKGATQAGQGPAPPAAPTVEMEGGMGGGNFTQKDLDNAKVPAPPGEDSSLDVLLRPGLLADVEIIVEKVTNAIYVPNQAIFEQDNKPVVYVKGPKGGFEARPIKIAKRSETVSVIGEGVKVGETIAMQDPTQKPGEKKAKKEESKSGASGALPSGAAGGGR